MFIIYTYVKDVSPELLVGMQFLEKSKHVLCSKLTNIFKLSLGYYVTDKFLSCFDEDMPFS